MREYNKAKILDRVTELQTSLTKANQIPDIEQRDKARSMIKGKIHEEIKKLNKLYGG